MNSAARMGAWGLAAALGLSALSPHADAQQTRAKSAAKPPPASPTTQADPPVTSAPAATPQTAGAAPTSAVEASAAFDPSTPQELATGYPLGVGDVVKVVVFQQPDLTVETRVSEVGTISVPLLGAVPVGGVTAKRAEDRIAALLKGRGFVRDPQVVVTVLQFKSRQVSVLGLVNRPGRYAMEEGVYRLSDLIAMAGGALPDAADTVTLVRTVGGKSQRYEMDLPALFRAGDFSNNPEIIAGDSIYVARAPVFYIYGEVNRPGMFRLEKDMTVMQALSVGGGVTQRGTDKSVQVRRRDASAQYSVTRASLSDRVQQDDVIFVKESLF